MDVRHDDSGQSIVEFLLLLPVILGLTIVLTRVNSAIQISIVNQQYARASALWYPFNSPIYPELKIRQGFIFDAKKGINRFIVGVSRNAADKDSEGGGKRYIPEASTQLIARSKAKGGGAGPAQSEPDKRGEVVIRTTVALCTQSNSLRTKDGFMAATSMNMGEPFNPQAFVFCRSPLDE